MNDSCTALKTKHEIQKHIMLSLKLNLFQAFWDMHLLKATKPYVLQRVQTCVLLTDLDLIIHKLLSAGTREFCTRAAPAL